MLKFTENFAFSYMPIYNYYSILAWTACIRFILHRTACPPNERKDASMSVTVKDCLDLPIFSSAMIAAGEAGLDRRVDSVTIAEVIVESEEEFKKVAKPNELTISAFATIAHDPGLQVLTVRRSVMNGGSGLVLFYVGFYLKVLSQELLDAANDLNYPIIVIPSELGIAYMDIVSAVMELISREKLQDKTAREAANDYVCAVLNSNKAQSDIIAKKLGINSDNLYGICIFSQTPGSQGNNSALSLSEQFSDMLKELGISNLSSVVKNRIVFLLFAGSKKQSTFSAFREEYKNFIAKITDSEVLIFSYLNKHKKSSFRNLYLDFCKAVDILPLIFPYRNDFDSYSVQFALNCTNIIENDQGFFDESSIYSLLQELSEEDLQTLSIYMLDSNMSAAMAAKLLYVHTNTITYRINKIKERLHLSFSDISEINSLGAALAVRRILQANKTK